MLCFDGTAHASWPIFCHLDNVETFSTPNVKRFQGSQPKTLAHRLTAKLSSFSGHPMIEHFCYLTSIAPAGTAPKMTIPAPNASLAHRGKSILDGSVYGSFEEFYADLGETYRQAVCGFGEAGCRYLQLDEIWVTIGAPAGDGGRLLCRKLDCCW
jgi:5-methyltetrahydropteroyltriglutamate--homocysteine methyltransferase